MTTKTMLLLTLLLATSCQEPDSVLLVGLSCDPNAAPAYSIQVCLSEPSNIDDTKTFPAIPSDQPLAFPTTLALVIPRSHSGSIDLAFLALGTTSRATAHATSQVTLEEGAQDTVKVKLIAGDETCGNGIVDPGEGCDDGNLFSFDGCDDNCQLEPASTAGPPDAGTSSHPDAAPAIPPQPDALPAQSPDATIPPDTSPPLGPNGTPCSIHSQDVPCLLDGSPCTLYSQCVSWFCDTWHTNTCTQPVALGAACTASTQCKSGCCENNQCVPYTLTCPA